MGGTRQVRGVSEAGTCSEIVFYIQLFTVAVEKESILVLVAFLDVGFRESAPMSCLKGSVNIRVFL